MIFKYMKEWFLDIGQQAALNSDSWKKDNKGGESQNIARRVLRLQLREGDPNQSPLVSLSSRDRVQNLGRPRKLEFAGQKFHEGKCCMQRELRRSMKGFLWVFSQVFMCSCMWETVWGWEESPEWRRWSDPRPHRAGNSSCSHLLQEEELLMYKALSKVLGRILS